LGGFFERDTPRAFALAAFEHAAQRGRVFSTGMAASTPHPRQVTSTFIPTPPGKKKGEDFLVLSVGV